MTLSTTNNFHPQFLENNSSFLQTPTGVYKIMKSPRELKYTLTREDVDTLRLIPPNEGGSKRSSIDSSNTITCEGRSNRSNSTNSTILSIVSTEETKDFKKTEMIELTTRNEFVDYRRKHSATSSGKTTPVLLHPPNMPHIFTYGNSKVLTTRSTTSSPQRCRDKRQIFRMGSTLALSLDGTNMQYPLISHNKDEELELARRNSSKQNCSKSFSQKKFISAKNAKSPTTNRKSIFSTHSKSLSPYNSLEEDHSRKSSLSSVGSGFGGEGGGLHTKKGISVSPNTKYLTAAGRPFSGFAHSSPNSPTKGNSGKKSNLLMLSRATPCVFTSITGELTSSKSTSASPKNSPAKKRNLFTSIPYKAASMDDGNLHGRLRTRRNDSISSTSSERSSQGNLLQIPQTSSYKVRSM